MYLSYRAGLAVLGMLTLSACSEPLDFDLRGLTGGFSTADAAQSATAPRPKPDERGVISYPTYQVAVAQRGDTLETVSQRIGVPATELASFNGIATDATLRRGEVIALPRRIENSNQTTTPASASSVDVTTLAGQAIDNAPNTTPAAVNLPETGAEPIRHRVARGESAYTISRLYGVPVKALGDWNGLGSDFSVREGQYLLIPVVRGDQAEPTLVSQEPAVTAPGEGTETPTPPSASKPLPEDDTAVAAAPPPVPDVGETTIAPTSKGKMALPVPGSIIREYSKSKNEGIDIKGNPGAAVGAAAEGSIAAITASADGVPIIVVRHPDNVLTVYANVTGVTVKKGDKVRKGQKLAKLRDGDQSYVHFEVREGFDSVDPAVYLQ